MTGTFCATSTVTGYPCFSVNLINIKLANTTDVVTEITNSSPQKMIRKAREKMMVFEQFLAFVFMQFFFV